MTTAARPTFDTARGGTGARERDLSAMTKQYSARDLPSHTSLKSREKGQGNVEDLSKRDFRRELEEREHEAQREKDDKRRQLDRERGRVTSSLESSSGGSKKSRLEGPSSSATPAAPVNLDADDPIEDSDEDSDDSDDDDDDTAALMAELQKIKKEKAVEEQEKEEERKQEEERIRMENILSGNPLLKDKYAPSSEKSDLRLKRRWDDDVVFKNCSRAEPDKKEKTFINDSLRSDFHRKFMDKYVK